MLFACGAMAATANSNDGCTRCTEEYLVFAAPASPCHCIGAFPCYCRLTCKLSAGRLRVGPQAANRCFVLHPPIVPAPSQPMHTRKELLATIMSEVGPNYFRQQCCLSEGS
eukprot:GHVU01089515.1.p2 GENE.GHVU01089515.1~~GHVU01089515.1.p2  ORF type:complete len:111 (-),score=1.93 GHVU01089515.1:145-477(-)